MADLASPSLNRSAARDRSCRPTRRPSRGSCCVHLEEPPDRPDPAIYSQAERLGSGIEASWNSPDITTNFWSPWRLMPEPEVVVRNLSPSASAVGVQVQIKIAPFGIGTPKTPISAQVLNLAPSEERKLVFALPQSVLTGDPHVGVFVEIAHSVDKNVANNRGDQVIDGVFTSEAGRSLTFKFPVRNDEPQPRTLTLATLGNDLGAAVFPASHSFSPFEQIVATLTAHVPSALHGTPGSDIRREVTVVARDGAGRLVGGVTFIVRIDE